MKITEINFNETITNSIGLSKVKMSKISNIVLLAGKNGSGKTRLLNLVSQQAMNLKSFIEQRNNALPTIQNHENAIQNIRNQLEQIKIQSTTSVAQIKELENRIDSYQKVVSQQNELLHSPIPIIMDNDESNITVVDFVPNQIELQDWANQSKQGWMNQANQAKNLGVKHLYQSTLPLIQQVLERWVNTTHQNLKFSKEEIDETINDYNRLQTIVKSFLGVEIGWNRDGYSTIFEKPIAQAQLSAGQKVLLQLCVAIYAQGGTLSNHIIFMDEPENHLHPSAVVDLLDSIKQHNPNGQIWIATHSIPLLSHFEASSLWFVEGGTVRHSGKKPELVLESLLGNEERIQKLRDFTSLPNELARNRFAFECLFQPNVVETDSKDPQSIQLHEQLKLIWENKTSISILDFGAGKGRMIANLSDYKDISSDTLDYYAYDSFTEDKEYCIKNIALSYNDAEVRYYNSIDEMRTKLDDYYFDVIVLSNVLHEIPYSKWCETFGNIKKLLKQDGYVLIIEDCRISTGELPHINGFIVFNTLHLKKLFNISATEEKFIYHDARFESEEQRGRLMAHLIPAKYLEFISIETIKSALFELKDTSKTEILKIRGKEATYSNGLAHSFWIQQLANVTLSLAEMGDN